MADRQCVIEACEQPAGVPGTAKGMCRGHYKKLRKYGDPLVVVRKRNICAIDDCAAFCYAQGWCSKHFTRWRRFGDPLHRLKGEVRDGRRICPACGQDRPVEEFGTNIRTKSGAAPFCRDCTRAKTAAWRRLNPGYVAPQRDRAQAAAYARTWRRANPEQVREHRVTRRARRRSALVERFSPFEIFERDEWTCWLCQEPIPKDVPYPDPRSASLDHRIPLARHGKHSRANCAASHLRCNLRKHAKLVMING